MRLLLFFVIYLLFCIILAFSFVFQAECFHILSLGVCYEPYLPNIMLTFYIPIEDNV
jgi:hypothetical protein